VIDGDWYVTGCGGGGGGEGGEIFRPGHIVFCGRCGALSHPIDGGSDDDCDYY